MTKVSFNIEVDVVGRRLRIYPGSVEGVGIPLKIYCDILKALDDIQRMYNEPQKITQDNQAAPVAETPDVVPPPPVAENSSVQKMKKGYTEEEKRQIAELYNAGRPVSEIALQFGRNTGAIYKLVNAMGERRAPVRNKRAQADASSPASGAPGKRKSALVKPWYLK